MQKHKAGGWKLSVLTGSVYTVPTIWKERKERRGLDASISVFFSSLQTDDMQDCMWSSTYCTDTQLDQYVSVVKSNSITRILKGQRVII